MGRPRRSRTTEAPRMCAARTGTRTPRASARSSSRSFRHCCARRPNRHDRTHLGCPRPGAPDSASHRRASRCSSRLPLPPPPFQSCETAWLPRRRTSSRTMGHGLIWSRLLRGQPSVRPALERLAAVESNHGVSACDHPPGESDRHASWAFRNWGALGSIAPPRSSRRLACPFVKVGSGKFCTPCDRMQCEYRKSCASCCCACAAVCWPSFGSRCRHALFAD